MKKSQDSGEIKIIEKEWIKVGGRGHKSNLERSVYDLGLNCDIQRIEKR